MKTEQNHSSEMGLLGGGDNYHGLTFSSSMKRQQIGLLQTKSLVTGLCSCSQLFRHPSDELKLLSGPKSPSVQV